MINSMAFKNKNDILASAPKDGFLLITSFPSTQALGRKPKESPPQTFSSPGLPTSERSERHTRTTYSCALDKWTDGQPRGLQLSPLNRLLGRDSPGTAKNTGPRRMHLSIKYGGGKIRIDYNRKHYEQWKCIPSSQTLPVPPQMSEVSIVNILSYIQLLHVPYVIFFQNTIIYINFVNCWAHWANDSTRRSCRGCCNAPLRAVPQHRNLWA